MKIQRDDLFQALTDEQPFLSDERICYYSLAPNFEVTVKNNSSAPIDIYNIIFLEQYTSPGKKEDVEYYNGWRRVPYNYANYFADKPAKTTLLPGEETILVFYHDIYLRYDFLGPKDYQGSFLNQFPVTAGKYRLAVYMDGGVRYVDFYYIIKRLL
ncbi:MAG: hypothetical protein IJW87_05160 [Clostridia bacterium]|nr:hypothetical protein [Clostridia bacterium]